MTRIICWGLGYWFDRFIKGYNQTKIEIVAITDRDLEAAKAKQEAFGLDCKVITADGITTIDFDYIVICTSDYYYDIWLHLVSSDIPKDKICCLPNTIQLSKLVAHHVMDYDANMYEIEALFQYSLYSTDSKANQFFINSDKNGKGGYDYTRISVLELITKQILQRKVKGDMAELGVYRGEFAGTMSTFLPDRRIYLFDTFESFDSRDTDFEEKTYGELAGVRVLNEELRETSLEIAMKNMPDKEKVTVCKGYFPDTTKGFPEDVRFCLVSIDTDLYSPTYAGLKWFWERLAPGGFIMIHDYDCPPLPGVKDAVDKFAQEYGVSVFPLCDTARSAVISKNPEPGKKGDEV